MDGRADGRWQCQLSDLLPLNNLSRTSQTLRGGFSELPSVNAGRVGSATPDSSTKGAPTPPSVSWGASPSGAAAGSSHVFCLRSRAAAASLLREGEWNKEFPAHPAVVACLNTPLPDQPSRLQPCNGSNFMPTGVRPVRCVPAGTSAAAFAAQLRRCATSRVHFLLHSQQRRVRLHGFCDGVHLCAGCQPRQLGKPVRRYNVLRGLRRLWLPAQVVPVPLASSTLSSLAPHSRT